MNWLQQYCLGQSTNNIDILFQHPHDVLKLTTISITITFQCIYDVG